MQETTRNMTSVFLRSDSNLTRSFCLVFGRDERGGFCRLVEGPGFAGVDGETNPTIARPSSTVLSPEGKGGAAADDPNSLMRRVRDACA